MKQHAYLILLLAFPVIAAAQSLRPYSVETLWKTTGIQSDVLYVSPAEAVLPVRETKGYAVVMMTDQVQEKWRTRIDGTLLGICKFQSNILAIYETQRAIHAALLDPSSGRTLQTKELLKTGPSGQVLTELHKNAAGDFQQLLIRHVNVNQQTEKIRTFNIAAGLQATETASIEAGKDVAYHGAIALANSLFVLWMDKRSSIILQQYNNGEAVARLSTQLRHDGTSPVSLSAVINPARTTDVLCFVKYKNESRIIRTIFFDLASNEVKFTDDVVDRNYREKIQDIAEVVGSKKQIPSAGFDNLSVVGATFYNNLPVVIKEVSAPGGNPPYSGAAIISVLNRDLTAQKHFLIDKLFRSNMYLPVLSHRTVGNKLQVLASNSKFVGASTLLFGEIDLDKLKWVRLAPVMTSRNTDPNSNPMDGNAMLWFGDKPLVPHHMGRLGYRYQSLALNE